MTTEATESLKRVEAKIFPDQYPESPRTSQDNLTTMVYGHRRYIVGDRQPDEDEVAILERGGWNTLLDAYLKRGDSHGDGKILWARKYGLYAHSGVAIYLGGGASPFDPGGWDSGMVGIIFVTEGQRALLGVPLDTVEQSALTEFKEYDQYLRGEVYGYSITEYDICPTCQHAQASEVTEQCFGFIGDDPEKNGMADNVDEEYRQVLIDQYKKHGVTYGR